MVRLEWRNIPFNKALVSLRIWSRPQKNNIFTRMKPTGDFDPFALCFSRSLTIKLGLFVVGVVVICDVGVVVKDRR